MKINNPAISVVIPVYNVEAFLEECLDSVLEQTESDIEIICINDGSTDGSREILKDYSNRDKRIIVIDKENGGLSSARNMGLDAARGKYLYYLDSDDKIRPDALSICKEVSEKEQLDVLFFDGLSFFECEELRVSKPHLESYLVRPMLYSGVTSGAKLFCDNIQNWVFRPSVMVQFCNRQYLINNNLRFFEGIIFEDADYSLRLILQARRAMHISETLFFRRVRQESIVTSKINTHRVYSRFISLKQMQFFLQGINYTPEVLESVKSVLRSRQIKIVRDYNRISKEQQEELAKTLSASETLEFAVIVETVAEVYTKSINRKHALEEKEAQLNSMANSRSYKLASKASAIWNKLMGRIPRS